VGKRFTPVHDRLETYEAVRKRVEEGVPLEYSKLINDLRIAGYVLPSRMTLRRWIDGKTSPFSGKRIFIPRPSEELSFFIGAWLGDGWGDENDGGKRMLLKVRSYDFAKEFADCAAKILGKSDSYWVRRVHEEDGEWFLVKVTSFTLFEFVSQPFKDLHQYIHDSPRGFLRGFFTAEGNPSVSVENADVPYLGVGVDATNSDTELLNFARDLLLDIGYRPGKNRVSTEEGERTNFGVAKNTIYVFTLSTYDDVKRFASEIGFADSKKNEKLSDALTLIECFGKHKAVDEWKRFYQKIGRKWSKKSATSSI
jgi:intein-encoded DNA endonuclease-like protein